MNSFSFHSVHASVCERGAAARIADFCGELSTGPDLLVVTDALLLDLGVVQPALGHLRANGFNPVVYSDVVPDPPEAKVLAAVALAKQNRVGGVIGLGGGSSMDVAKLVALLAHPAATQSLQEIYGIQQARGERLPLVQVPTTAGTGSEATPISIITTGETTKSGVVDWKLLADLVVLDAELTRGLPPVPTAATGIDAMVHAIEAYTSRHKKNPISDMFARRALRLLAANIRAACADGDDLDARENMLLGANLAGQAFANAPVAAVHALAYPLGGHFHIAHGESNALVLPHVLRFNRAAAAPLYCEITPDVFPELAAAGETERLDGFIDGIARLNGDLLGRVRLRDYDIPADFLPKLAEDAMLQTRLLVNNPREIDYDQALAIYQEAY